MFMNSNTGVKTSNLEKYGTQDPTTLMSGYLWFLPWLENEFAAHTKGLRKIAHIATPPNVNIKNIFLHLANIYICLTSWFWDEQGSGSPALAAFGGRPGLLSLLFCSVATVDPCSLARTPSVRCMASGEKMWPGKLLCVYVCFDHFNSSAKTIFSWILQ